MRPKDPLRDLSTDISTLRHAVESVTKQAQHFAGHYGQILLIKHLMRDAGVLKEPKK